MESYKTFGIIVIVTVSTLVTILTPVESKGVPLGDTFVSRSLLSESPSPAPAPGPEATTPIPVPANPPTKYIDSPAASPAESISPANPPTKYTDSPAASPGSPADSISPTDPPTETELDSPGIAPADSISAPNPSAEIAADSPTPSPEAPTDSEENPVGPSSSSPSGKTLMNSATDILNQPLLSPEIKNICAKTDSPPLCESSVSSLLTAQIKPDTSSVLVLAIQASIEATKAAMSIVDKVAAADCQELYDDAVANLEDAINAVKARDIATVNTNLSAAMTDYGTCNDGFEESGEPNPLADVSHKLTKMVSNSLAISTLIK